MIGKVWIFITAFSFITYVHYAQPACMPNDLKTHLDDCLLEEHLFQMKVFSSETKEHELLSIINTLCSTWTKNREKDIKKIRVVETFEIMLNNFSENVDQLCVDLNCTDAYTVSTVNTTVFGDMYRRSCSGPVSDLKCPSKGTTTIRPKVVESTTFFTTVNSVTTAHKSTTSLTAVSPNITAPENLTTNSSEPTESMIQALKDGNHNLWSIIQMFFGALTFSLLLNVALFLLVLKYRKKCQTNIHGESSAWHRTVFEFVADITTSTSLYSTQNTSTQPVHVSISECDCPECTSVTVILNLISTSAHGF
ncbi:uncharacterized protein LOC125277149 isoform X2 [Megalobrama amblycephala]|uniref:uncharacterized protein LOC125277149 isoform X2 n=1 Tax=Megalobrama amblycephala TaxID=75352 RepID=UPI0020146558|nr:uncharacterized protein LOC125277149 isoform X2 [Megalobrama amblycephala]